MDYTVTSNVDYRLKYMWTYIMSTAFSSGTFTGISRVMPAKILGYGGAGLATLLSVSGAITCGSTVMSNLQASFFAVLEDYQDNDSWNIIDDENESEEFGNFITVYAFDTAILMLAAFWHVAYLVGMGIVASFLIFNKINTYSNDSTYSYGGTDIPVNFGFQLFAFGALLGAVDYLGGIALTYDSQSLLNMLSFFDKTKTSVTTISTTTVDAEGSSVFTKTANKYGYRKKDLFTLYDMQGNWGNLFWSQRLLQMVQPYVYIAMIEIAVAIVFALTLVFGGVL